MSETTRTTDVLEAMWATLGTPGSKRATIARWRKILNGSFSPKVLVVLKIGRDHLLVESRKRPREFHSVDVSRNEPHCSCEDATLSGNPKCFHINLARELKKEGRLEI